MPSDRSRENANYGGSYNTGEGYPVPPAQPKYGAQYDPADQASEQERLRKQGLDAAGRPAFTANTGPTDAARGQALDARTGMVDAVEQARIAAQGDPNSVAQQQLRGNLATAQQNVKTVAASTHGGPLAAAAAGRQALVTGGNIQAGGVSQAAGLKASEMATGRDAYGRATNELRTFDQSMQGQDAKQAMDARNSAAYQEELARKHQRFYEDEATKRGEQGEANRHGQEDVSTAGDVQRDKRLAADRAQDIKTVGAIFKGVGGGMPSDDSDARAKKPSRLSEAAVHSMRSR